MENRRRTTDDGVSHAEFALYKTETAKHRYDMQRRMDDIHTAIFATDADNSNDQPGLMITAKKISDHIDNVCKVAKWGWRLIVGFTTFAASTAIFAHQMGWL